MNLNSIAEPENNVSVIEPKLETRVDLRDQPLPDCFKQNIYEISFTLPVTQKVAFEWLLKKKTFSRGHLPPYKVEFVPDDKEALFMKVGDYTNHHGPFLQFAGVLTKITSNYRRLDYMYGSHAISARMFRPLCLELWVKDMPGTVTSKKPKCVVKLRLTTGVCKNASGLWTLMMKIFWPQFAINAKLLWMFSKSA